MEKKELQEDRVPDSEEEASDVDTDPEEGDIIWDSDSFSPRLNKMVTRLQRQLQEEPLPVPAEETHSGGSAEGSGEETDGSDSDSDYS